VLAVMGGVEVNVPGTWAVQVEHKMIAGGVDVRLPDIQDLPADAPQLTIHVRACMGGVKAGTTTS